MRSIIVEGIDRLGKDTLIKGVLNRLGYFQHHHFQKPQLLDCYVQKARVELSRRDDDLGEQVKQFALREYQHQSFVDMLHMLSSKGRFLLNRAHLGEYVYSKRYRGYDGSYVFDLEEQFIDRWGSDFHQETLLVVLHTSNFSFIEDDGLSFDFDKKEEEQNDFLRAFDRSFIKHRLLIDVHAGNGTFAPADAIVNTVCKAFNELPSAIHPIWNVSWKQTDHGTERVDYLQPDPKNNIS